jgi:rRNA maturation RNase YbeY
VYLLEINKQYLGHDYFTDIISFQHNELNEDVEGDVYISIERVKENSSSLKQPFEEELFRVISHGLLHFLGYKDKTEAGSQEMRTKEDWCLSLRDF